MVARVPRTLPLFSKLTVTWSEPTKSFSSIEFVIQSEEEAIEYDTSGSLYNSRFELAFLWTGNRRIFDAINFRGNNQHIN